MNKLQKTLCLGLMCGLLGSIGAAGTASAASGDMAIVKSSSGKAISVSQLAKEAAPYQVVFFGEFHDQDSLHKLELELLKKMYAIHGDKLTLSMEMFEVDNQGKLNDYLAGKLSEEDFLKTSRPWPNYSTDYRPLVEFAKAHKMPVIASNIPRFLASTMAKAGSVDGVEPQFKQYLPRHTYAPEGKYKDKFFGYMTGSSEMGMRIPPARLNQAFAAQCIKDDKMAESIYYYLEENQDKVVLHINGCFHSDAHLGTAEKLEALSPQLKTVVITPKDMPADKNYISRLDGDKQDGEYVVYFTRVDKNAGQDKK